MFKSFAQAIILITLITLVSACGPAAAPVSPTTTIAPTPSTAHGQTISTETYPAVVLPIETAVPPAAPPAPLTAEQLIAKCAQAMGGSEKIDALQTLRLAQHFPDHTGLIRYEIKRPNLARMGDDLAFDGKQAFWLTKTEPVPQQEWKDFEMDIAWYVPAFFDYPAEYLGTEMVDSNWTYKLQAPLPLGAVMLYHLDAETYLVYRASSDVVIGEKQYHYERTFSDYRLVDGILYPHAFTYLGRNGVDLLTATIETIEFNVLLENERFAVPKPTSTPPPAVQLEQVVAFDQPAFFVHAVAFSPDGRYLITADQNGDVIIREVGTWKEHRRFTTQADIASAPLSPDGTVIVTGGAAGSVVAWDLAGNALFSIPYSGAVFCAQFSPDGRYLVVGGENDRVMIVDVATQQKVTDLVSDHHYVTNLVFSPDGKTLLVSYERPENVIKVWDTSTWEEGATFSHVTERIDYHDLVFSPDGRYLVVASTQNAIKFLDVVTWQVVKELEGHTRGTYQVAFLPGGALLVSACDDGTLRLWDVETGDSLRTIRGYRENVALALSPDGAWIAFSGRGEGVQVWAVSPAASSSPAPKPTPRTVTDALPITPGTVEEIELLCTLEGHTGRVYGLDFSSDGRLLASGSWDGTIRLWDVETWQQIGLVNQDGQWQVFFVPDDAHVASANGTIVDVASGEIVHTPEERNPHVTFSPDGAWMALAGYNAPIDIWDVKAWQVVQTLAGHTDRVFGLAFSPDGRLLASGSGMGPSDVSDFVVKVWDIASGSEAHTLKGHSGDIHAVAFSPDGTLVASASTDHTVRVWDVQSGALVHTLRHGNGLYGVTFAPDGRLLASAGCDRTVKLWDVASGQLLRSLPHGDEVMAVAFSPDGALLASGGYDKQVYLWGVSR